MKDNSSSIVVDRIGEFTETKFGIASSADLVYIFDILRNKLYSDKIMAVIREYSTNAMDANVEAGYLTRPIIIYAPTSLKPQFRVRDFGMGLSEDQIRSTYCMYGRSTKRESNEYTGQLGLGSKSGFAYGDSFLITSCVNGIKTVYSAYIDESKLGAISKLVTEETSEESGMEISIPVKEGDMISFSQKISYLIKHFKIKPITHGLVLAAAEEEALFQGDNWKLFSSSTNATRGERLQAVMGNIAYPIDSSQIDSSNPYAHTYKDSYPMLRQALTINFEIGELNIAASRESLEYNDSTIETIKQKLNTVYIEFKNQIETKIANCQDIVEAKLLYYKVSSSLGYRASHILGNIVYNNQNVVDSSLKIEEKSDVTVFRFEAKSKKSGSKVVSSQRQYIPLSTQALTNKTIWYSDEPKSSVAKMRHMAESNQGKEFHFLRSISADNSIPDSWFVEQGIPKKYFCPISEYQIPAKQKIARPKSVTVKNAVMAYTIKKDGIRHHKKPSDGWEASSILIQDVEVYVEINGFAAMMTLDSEKSVKHPRNIEVVVDMIAHCERHSIVLPTVYGIKTKDLNKVTTAVSLDDFYKTEMSKNLEYLQKLHASRIKQTIEADELHAPFVCMMEQAPFGGHSEITILDKSVLKLMSIIKELRKKPAKNTYTNASTYGTYLNYVKAEIENQEYKKEMQELIELMKTIREKYPLIRYCTSTHFYPQAKFDSNATRKYINDTLKADQNSN